MHSLRDWVALVSTVVLVELGFLAVSRRGARVRAEDFGWAAGRAR